MDNRPGCLSASGLIFATLTLALIGGLLLVNGGEMFSPGDLNAQAGDTPLGGVWSHAETQKCRACHTAPWGSAVMADRCVACHVEITPQLSDAQSLHGVLLQDQALTCNDCHPDHRGVSAPLTILDPGDFPHEAVGFSLQAHTQNADGTRFDCADCHLESLTQFEVAACEECHQNLDADFTQFHVAAFGRACLGCHDGIDTYGADFDHNPFFALDGTHASGTCGGCHEGARTIAEFRDAPQDCYACHAEDDEHNGRFGENCAMCHTAADWEQATFDHALSTFPLIGKHTDVECEACHRNDVYVGTPQECYACHEEDDEHKGEFGTDCAACHTPETWEDAIFDHTLSAFPLTGAHVDVDCEQCHVDNRFAGTPQECLSCHEDPIYHRDRFGTDCALCHTTAAWSPAEYNEPHTFPFNHGESGTNACRVCHPESLDVYTCYECHEHNAAEVESKHREEGITNFANCMECHPTGREDEGGNRGDGDGDDD